MSPSLRGVFKGEKAVVYLRLESTYLDDASQHPPHAALREAPAGGAALPLVRDINVMGFGFAETITEGGQSIIQSVFLRRRCMRVLVCAMPFPLT